MTNAEIIQAIKNEIESLKAKYRKDMHKSSHEGLASGYKIEAYNELLSFLSTLESEKPMNQDEVLNEEIKKEMAKLPFFIRGKDLIAYARHFAQWGAEHAKIESEKPVPNDLEEAAKEYAEGIIQREDALMCKQAFIAGAKWQAEQLLKSSPLPEDTVLFNKGVEEGKRLMMEEAVEGEVVKDINNKLSVTAKNVNLDKFKFGDKVRVIVLPKED